MQWELKEGFWKEVLSDLGLKYKLEISVQMRGVRVRHVEECPGSGNRVDEGMEADRPWRICTGNQCLVHEHSWGRQIRLRRRVGWSTEGFARLAVDRLLIKYRETRNTLRKVYNTQVCVNVELNKLSVIGCFPHLWLL